MADDTNTAERDALMYLIDAYAEARHIGGCHTYNATTAEARAKVVASLAASEGSEPVARVNDDGFIVEIGDLLIAPGQKLYTHPSPSDGMAGWKPIATAPKDGTLILVHFKSKGVRAVSWDSPFHDEVTEENGIWCVDDDKHGPYGLRGYNDDGPTAPTHWMPLPAPPLPASEAKEL